jgi:hypothetical protein
MATHAAKETAAFEKFPPIAHCRVINFDSATVMNLSAHIHFLVVKGKKPYVNMKVYLNPRVYVTKPDYWEYDVVGCVGDFLIPSEAPYVAVKNVSFSRGKKGIEVVGANKRLKIAIP